jgi:hypothetical protein
MFIVLTSVVYVCCQKDVLSLCILAPRSYIIWKWYQCVERERERKFVVTFSYHCEFCGWLKVVTELSYVIISRKCCQHIEIVAKVSFLSTLTPVFKVHHVIVAKSCKDWGANSYSLFLLIRLPSILKYVILTHTSKKPIIGSALRMAE